MKDSFCRSSEARAEEPPEHLTESLEVVDHPTLGGALLLHLLQRHFFQLVLLNEVQDRGEDLITRDEVAPDGLVPLDTFIRVAVVGV